jgi:two-component system heavy metal sensor histidine kinase CusS
MLVGMTYIYWALVANLDREDDHTLADQVRTVAVVLKDSPVDFAALKRQVEVTAAGREDTKIYLRVLNDRNDVIASTPGMDSLVPRENLPDPVEIRSARFTGEQFRSPYGSNFRVMAVREHGSDGRPYAIQAAMDRSHEEALLDDYRRNLWIVLGGSLVACSLGGYFLVQRAIRPVKTIVATAGGIRSSTLDQRIDPSGLPSELRSLANSFNEMLDRLEQSFARLSQFSADIAHELRTPLNNLRGEAEVALGRSRSTEEYKELIGSALEEYGRLARLIDSLLFLARAEDPATRVAREPVDVGQELDRLREFYEAAAQDASVRIVVESPAELTAALDRTLMQRAVGNLIENALSHTPSQGCVSLLASKDDGWLCIDVMDTGEGISAEHIPKLFDRFYRADQARRSGSGASIGLGLAIVRSIATLHGGTVEIKSQERQGTRVRLRVPIERPGPLPLE